MRSEPRYAALCNLGGYKWRAALGRYLARMK